MCDDHGKIGIRERPQMPAKAKCGNSIPAGGNCPLLPFASASCHRVSSSRPLEPKFSALKIQ